MAATVVWFITTKQNIYSCEVFFYLTIFRPDGLKISSLRSLE